MKKIFTIFLFVAMFIGATAQDYDEFDRHYYVTASITIGDNIMASDFHEHPWTGKTGMLSAGLLFKYPINDIVKWRLNGTLNFGQSGDDQIFMVIFGTSLDFHITNHIYWYASMYPRLDIHGNGVQTNGDILDFWVIMTTGPGFEWRFDNNEIFAEIGITRDIDIFSQYNTHHNDVFILATVGYRYIIR